MALPKGLEVMMVFYNGTVEKLVFTYICDITCQNQTFVTEVSC